MSITASGGYFHGYLNGTEYPFYFNGYKKTETYTRAQIDSLINSLKTRISTLENNGGGIKKQSFGQNGYIEFTNGLIMQWGKTGAISGWGTNNNVSFHKPFKSDCYFVTYARVTTSTNNYIWYQEDYSGSTNTLTVGSKTKNGFSFAGYMNQPVIWLAIGK